MTDWFHNTHVLGTMFGKPLLILLLACLWLNPTSGERWDVIVKTSNRMWSGTNSDIAIEIFGTEGHVGKSGLHGSFEKGDTDTTPFYINIGEPYKIRIFHDGSGPSSGWRLDWVKLKSFQTYNTYNFRCNCKLDGGTKYIDGDTQVCKDIPRCKSGQMHCRSSIYDSLCRQCDDPYYGPGYGRGCQPCSTISKCTDRFCRSSSDVKCRRCEDNNVYYKVSSDGKKCDVCPNVTKCVDQYCSTGMQSTKCRKCEDDKVFYKVSTDKTRCERMCAWNNHYCWPGTCGDGLVKNCQCASGFQLTSTPTETSCQPQSSPTFETCATRTLVINGKMKMSKTVGPTTACEFQNDYYGNFIPDQHHFNVLAQYSVDTSTFPSNASYIESFNYGITDFTVDSVFRRIGARERILQTLPLLTDSSRSKNVNETIADERSLNVTNITLQSGDRYVYMTENVEVQ